MKKLRHSAGNVWRFALGRVLDVDVPLDLACNIFGVRFSGGYHHLVEVLKAHETGSFNLKESFFWKYHKRFTPETTRQALCLAPSPACDTSLFAYPWGTFRKDLIYSDKKPDKSRFCGPTSDEAIEGEFAATLRLLTALRDRGYRPYTYPNSFIGGVWLCSGDGRKVFIVLQGNHRVSCLAHLGVQSFAVRPLRSHYWTIADRDVRKWPLVASGQCDVTSAAEIFNAFLSDRGRLIYDRVEGVLSSRQWATRTSSLG